MTLGAQTNAPGRESGGRGRVRGRSRGVKRPRPSSVRVIGLEVKRGRLEPVGVTPGGASPRGSVTAHGLKPPTFPPLRYALGFPDSGPLGPGDAVELVCGPAFTRFQPSLVIAHHPMRGKLDRRFAFRNRIGQALAFVGGSGRMLAGSAGPVVLDLTIGAYSQLAVSSPVSVSLFAPSVDVALSLSPIDRGGYARLRLRAGPLPCRFYATFIGWRLEC